MSVHRDAYRLDQERLEIPEHLRYKPYTVPNPYVGVHARYLDHKQKKGPAPFKPESEVDRIHGNTRSFKNVQPRYLEPKHKNPHMQVPMNVYENDLKDHDSLRQRLGWAGVHPRYLDNVVPDHKIESPRDRTERHRKEQTRINSWKTNAVMGESYTFDEIRQRNKKYLKGQVDHADVKPVMKKPSVIGEYIRHGTPIKHHTFAESYVSPRREKETNDVNPTGWVPGGGCGGGRWFARSNSPVKASYHRVDDRVRSWREHAQDKRVMRNSVPRVAHLSPAESYSRLESPSRYGRAATTGTSGSQQQQQQQYRGSNGGGYEIAAEEEGDQEPEVLVGPLTVSVPPGAVVRLNRAMSSGR